MRAQGIFVAAATHRPQRTPATATCHPSPPTRAPAAATRHPRAQGLFVAAATCHPPPPSPPTRVAPNARTSPLRRRRHPSPPTATATVNLKPIPHSIAELLAKKHTETATLFSPLGKFWHVTLVKDGDSRVFFDNGWREFSRAHELVAGDFVLFRYEGNMVFKAKVFDTSGCLKLYDKIVHGVPKRSSIETEDENCNNIRSLRHSKSVRKRRAVTEELRAPPGFSAKEKSTKNQNSTNRLPHFEKIISHYNINQKSSRTCLCLPKSFRSSYELLRNEIVLRDPKKRSWPVTIWHGGEFCRIHKGWKEFAVGNNLQKGDKCIFQFVSSEEMQVLIQKRHCA